MADIYKSYLIFFVFELSTDCSHKNKNFSSFSSVFQDSWEWLGETRGLVTQQKSGNNREQEQGIYKLFLALMYKIG